MKTLLQINPVLRVNTSTGRIMQEIGELAMQHGWRSCIAYSTGRDGNVRTPVTLTPSGKVYYCSPEDWRSGFYAGSLWYLYELTADTALLNPAIRHTETLESAKNLT